MESSNSLQVAVKAPKLEGKNYGCWAVGFFSFFFFPFLVLSVAQLKGGS